MSVFGLGVGWIFQAVAAAAVRPAGAGTALAAGPVAVSAAVTRVSAAAASTGARIFALLIPAAPLIARPPQIREPVPR